MVRTVATSKKSAFDGIVIIIIKDLMNWSFYYFVGKIELTQTLKRW